MSEIQKLISDNLDIWTGAVKNKKAVGRGSSKKLELTGIKKLRELILELAVRGKLVPQDPNDEPASVLLEKITTEKERQIKDKIIKKQKPLSEIKGSERFFELPQGWCWVRLGELFNSIISGGTPSKREPSYWGGDIPWASVKDLGKRRYISETQDYITEKGLENGSKLADKSDILICTRMGLGKIAIAIVPIAFNQDLKAVKLASNVNVDFFLNTYSTLKIKGTGTTVAGIKQEELLNYVVGLPPLSEQHRIVAKVNELMVLCERLEQQSEESITTHQTLVDTLLDALVSPEQYATTFADSWTLIEPHFDILFTTEQSIDKLKQTILQLAVMGKLVPQNPNDEPASVLLEKITAEKEQLIKEKKIKKQKYLPRIDGDEQQINLAQGWMIIRFGQIINLVSGQHLKPQEYSEISEKGMIPYLTGPAEFGAVFPNATRYTYEKRAISNLGDLLITCKGSGVGKLNESNEQIAISRQLMAIQPILINTKFTKLLAESLNDHLRANVVGIAIPGISREDVTEAIISLPPEVEQHRIVVKVDELMTICDKLKIQITSNKTTQQLLADAFVNKTLAMELC